MEKVNLNEKFALFNDHWSPKIVGRVNDWYIKLAKLKGKFFWHYHDKEDEMFLVIKGSLTIRLRDRDVLLNEGEFFIIPHGVEHLPVAEEEVEVMLFEPKSTLNTGNLRNDSTITKLEEI